MVLSLSLKRFSEPAEPGAGMVISADTSSFPFPVLEFTREVRERVVISSMVTVESSRSNSQFFSTTELVLHLWVLEEKPERNGKLKQGKGDRPNKAEALTDNDTERLYSAETRRLKNNQLYR
ncbi:UNVERIFIED_CONTAM: hypothetical protein FKN15_070783 [Acipenser sinensis]